MQQVHTITYGDLWLLMNKHEIKLPGITTVIKDDTGLIQIFTTQGVYEGEATDVWRCHGQSAVICHNAEQLTEEGEKHNGSNS